jgi:hypothetical protein
MSAASEPLALLRRLMSLNILIINPSMLTPSGKLRNSHHFPTPIPISKFLNDLAHEEAASTEIKVRSVTPSTTIVQTTDVDEVLVIPDINSHPAKKKKKKKKKKKVTFSDIVAEVRQSHISASIPDFPPSFSIQPTITSDTPLIPPIRSSPSQPLLLSHKESQKSLVNVSVDINCHSENQKVSDPSSLSPTNCSNKEVKATHHLPSSSTATISTSACQDQPTKPVLNNNHPRLQHLSYQSVSTQAHKQLPDVVKLLRWWIACCEQQIEKFNHKSDYAFRTLGLLNELTPHITISQINKRSMNDIRQLIVDFRKRDSRNQEICNIHN